MNVNVIKVEERTDNWGTKKILHAANGQTYKVSSKSFAYQAIQGNGPYDITMGDYKGNPFVKNLKFLGEYQPPKTPLKLEGGKLVDERVKFEKAKQDEIKLECYAGIAKEIAIHNATLAKAYIDVKDVMNLAKDMFLIHNDIIALKESNALGMQGQAFDVELKKVFPDATVVESYDGEIPA